MGAIRLARDERGSVLSPLGMFFFFSLSLAYLMCSSVQHFARVFALSLLFFFF